MKASLPQHIQTYDAEQRPETGAQSSAGEPAQPATQASLPPPPPSSLARNGRAALERQIELGRGGLPPPPPPPVFAAASSAPAEVDLRSIYRNDLERVINGENKLLGYVGVHPLESEGLDKSQFEQAAQAAGKTARVIRDTTGPQPQDSFVIYDAARLRSLMQVPEYKAAIEAEGWPNDVHAFVDKVLSEWAQSAPLNELIGVAFDDEKYKGKLQAHWHAL